MFNIPDDPNRVAGEGEAPMDNMFNKRRYEGDLLEDCASVSWVHPDYRDKFGVPKAEQERMEKMDDDARLARIRYEMGLADPDSLAGMVHAMKELSDKVRAV